MELIYVKEVDKSLLYQGFTIRTALLNSFLGIFGKLDIGEMRQISILLNGKIYSGIKVVNQNFVSIRPRACFSPSYNKVKSQTKHVWLLTLL